MHDHETKAETDAPPTRELLATLVDNHRQFLGFLERRVGNRQLAEDILQEAFTKSIGKLESVREDESVVAWFYRILRNAAVDHGRRHRASEKALSRLVDELSSTEPPLPETHEAVCQCVNRLAATLKPEYAQALERVEVQGVPVKDFATELGITSGNAAVRVFRAREALKKQLMKSCGTCAEHGCLDCTCGQ